MPVLINFSDIFSWLCGGSYVFNDSLQLLYISLSDADVPKINAPLPVFVQQAAAAKTIG